MSTGYSRCAREPALRVRALKIVDLVSSHIRHDPDCTSSPCCPARPDRKWQRHRQSRKSLSRWTGRTLWITSRATVPTVRIVDRRSAVRVAKVTTTAVRTARGRTGNVTNRSASPLSSCVRNWSMRPSFLSQNSSRMTARWRKMHSVPSA